MVMVTANMRMMIGDEGDNGGGDGDNGVARKHRKL